MSSVDPLDVPAREKALAAEREQQREREQREVDDFKWLMHNERGRRVVWRLLEQSGVYRSSYADNANTTFFREGERNMGLRVLDMIHASAPEKYQQMILEHRYEQFSDLV